MEESAQWRGWYWALEEFVKYFSSDVAGGDFLTGDTLYPDSCSHGGDGNFSSGVSLTRTE